MEEFEAQPLLDGLVLQPWQPLKCDKIEYEDEEDDELMDLLDIQDTEIVNENNKLFQIKCIFTDQCIGILITDLINVWYAEQSQSEIMSMQRKLNPAMVITTTIDQINNQIQNMLCFADQKGSDHFKHILFKNENKTSFIFTTSMRIEDIIDFKWKLKFKKYGTSNDQATLLKQQLILPLMSIANELASKLNPTIQTNGNNNNSNTVFQQKITDTFLQFNIRGTMGDLYKNTMDFLTFSQMGGQRETQQQQQQEEEQQNIISNVVSNVVISSIPKQQQEMREIAGCKLPKLPKGRKKKRPLDDSMEDTMKSNKRRKINVNHNINTSDRESDDDVLNGLIGREDDLKMSEFDANDNNNNNKNGGDTMDTMDFMSTNTTNHSVLETQREREEIKKREELKQRLEAKRKDVKKQKKKKKKKNKLRI